MHWASENNAFSVWDDVSESQQQLQYISLNRTITRYV